MSKRSGVYSDYSRNQFEGDDYVVTVYQHDGISFEETDSNVSFDDNGKLRISEGTICLFGDFANDQDYYLFSKGANYELHLETSTSGGLDYFKLVFNGSESSGILQSDIDVKFIAVTFCDGYTPEFYLNGITQGNGTIAIAADDTDDENLIIGNNMDLNSPMVGYLKGFSMFNQVLSFREIKSLYQEYINEQYYVEVGQYE